MTTLGNMARMKAYKPVVLPQGTSSQTAAHQTMVANAVGSVSFGKKKSRRKKHAKSHVRVRRTRTKQRTLKKGSLAARRRMSAIRKLRGKKKTPSAAKAA